MSRTWTDRASVTARYSRPVAGGASIYHFRSPRRDWVGYVLDHVEWNPQATVLDAGCGRGAYLAGLGERVPRGTLIGADLTLPVLLGMTRPAHPRVGFINADVVRLPLPDRCVDVILSAHMLYHVPDIPAAMTEFRRVLRPGGELVAVYDSAIDDQPEMDELFLSSGGTTSLNAITNRFSLETAPGYLRAVFDNVVVHEERPDLLVPDVGAVVAGIDDLSVVAQDHLQPGLSWAEMLDRARCSVSEVVAREGRFKISEHKAVIVCS
jgi:SAM-dependent methyltransferase